MSTVKVQVITSTLQAPTPGILASTEDGDAIFIFDEGTGTMGIHRPHGLSPERVIDILSLIRKEYEARGEPPFILDSTAPLIIEDSFILRSRGEV